MTIQEVAAKIDALNVWKLALPSRWAIKPSGSAFPYFFCLIEGEVPAIKVRLLLLDGWQTFHDFIRTKMDSTFGIYSSPMELPHFELLVLNNGQTQLARYDTGFMPREATPDEATFCTRMLWQVYGVFLRLETEVTLPLKFADEKSMFARVEKADGTWQDEPILIPQPRPYVEQVTFEKTAIAKAKDLKIDPSAVWELDLRLVPHIMTRDKRPRTLYLLAAVHATSGELIFRDKVSLSPDGSLKKLWETMPARVLTHIIEKQIVPAELRTSSGRVFRILRPLCLELPFKLTKVAELPHFAVALNALI